MSPGMLPTSREVCGHCGEPFDNSDQTRYRCACAYQKAVERNLDGLNAVSTGVCGGCPDCREAYSQFDVREVYDYSGTLPIGWTFGDAEPDTWPTEADAEKASADAFTDAVSDGAVYSDPSFSWRGCGICGSTLGADLEVWHWVDSDNAIRHESDACPDCVAYLANGDALEGWKQ